MPVRREQTRSFITSHVTNTPIVHRIRHVKCDEAKPFCKRCLSTGRICDGFGYHQDFPSFTPLINWLPNHSTTAPGIQATQRERSMFSLLCTDTIPQVCGTFGHKFWKTDVLRATQVYPAIWHACLAVAAMHERMKMTESENAKAATQMLYEFSLRQYNAAIRHLLDIRRENVLTGDDQETLLMASILFNGLCCLQGDVQQAIIHARNGLQLFYLWRYWEQTYQTDTRRRRMSLLSAESLVMLISFTESQFMNRVANVPTTLLRCQIIPYKCSDMPFASITNAYVEFQNLYTGLLSATKFSDSPSCITLPLPRAEHRVAYRREFEVWKAKFEKFKQQSTLVTEEDTEGLLLLETLLTGVEVCLYVDINNAELDYDNYESAFSRIVDLAERVLSKRSYVAVDQGRGAPLFSFSLSLCEELYWAGIRCRNGIIRRRVIALLKKWPRRDGIWDSKMIASTCEAVMRLEESAVWSVDGTGPCCGCISGVFICNDHRVAGVDTEFLTSGTAKVTMHTVANLRYNVEGHTALISF